MPFIKYDFAIVGLNDVERGFATLEKRAVEHNRRVMSSMGFGPSARGGFGGGASSGIHAANTNASVREAERIEKARIRAEERVAAAKVKEAQKADAKVERLQQKETERWQKLAQRSADYRIREEERVTKARERLAKEEERNQERLLSRARQNYANTARGMIHGVGRTVGGALTAASALTGIGGAALFANATHEYMATKASASGLANTMADAGESAASINQRKGDILSAAIGVRGMRTVDKIEAARAFGGISGNYKLGLSMMGDLTNMSLATDVGLTDIARVAGSAYMKMKTPGMSEGQAKQQTLEAVRTFIGQGNIGAVEIKDLAQYGNRLTAGAAMFAGSRQQNMGYMGTLAQMAVGMGQAADAAEATTAAERFASDVTLHAKTIEKLQVGGKHVKAYTDSSKTQYREIPALLADIIQGTGGDMSKMHHIFGERSGKMATGFQQLYLDAERANAGLAPGERKAKGQAGREAILAKFEEFQKSAISEADVAERAKARLSDEDMILAGNMEKLNMAIGKELAPALTELFTELGNHKDEIVSFARAIEKTVAFLLKNPFEGLGVIVAAALVKELAVAGIGNLIKGAVSGAGAASGGIAGALGSGAGAAGAAGAARAAGGWSGVGGGLGILGSIAIGAATFEITTAILNAAHVGDGTEGAKPAIDAGITASNRVSEINASALNPEQKAERRLAALREESAKFEKEDNSAWHLFGAGSREAQATKEDFAKDIKVAEEQLAAARALKDAAELVGKSAQFGFAPQRSEQPSWTGYTPEGR